MIAIADELTEQGFVLRYRTEETDDGLHGEEGTFLICSFWLVSALSEIGEADRAAALCERLLSHASPLGLYAEELEADSGRHLGNFPQAFTHLALINAVIHVISDEELRVELRLDRRFGYPAACEVHLRVMRVHLRPGRRRPRRRHSRRHGLRRHPRDLVLPGLRCS